jgi:nitrogen-specific signal transduction histidine kinase
VILEWIADIFAIALERFELERQLQHAIKMEAIGTLSAGIAHDFNNILSVIMGFAELAKRQSKEQQPLQEGLEEIILACNRAKSLVDQLLTFSRKKSGEQGKVILSEVVKEVESFLRHTLPSSITLEVSISTCCLQVMGDAGQLHQLLLNLCTNARQAIGEVSGRIALALQHASLGVTEAQMAGVPPGEYACLQVQDSGVGMSKEVLEHIFEPFYTTKEVGKGTGLGLSVVHGIVSGHRGAIRVESVLGTGSLFAIYLPLLAIHAENSLALGGQQAVSEASGRVLVVDDEVQILTIYERMLTMIGYEVVAVSDAQEALRRFVAQPEQFAALVTDQVMPGMSGVELAARIKAVRPQLPIVLCTGLGGGGFGEEERFRCVDVLLRKPVPLSILRNELAKLGKRITV